MPALPSQSAKLPEPLVAMSGAPLLTLCCRSPRIADHVVPGEALSLEDFQNKANLTTLLDGEYLIVSAREGMGDSAFCAASHELTGGQRRQRRQLSTLRRHSGRQVGEASTACLRLTCLRTVHPLLGLKVNKPKDVVRLVTTTEQKVGHSICDGGQPEGHCCQAAHSATGCLASSQ